MTTQEVLLKCLQCAEEAINNVYPYAVADSEAEKQLNEKTENLNSAKSRVKDTSFVLKISIAATVVFYLISLIDALGILSALFRLISGISLFVLVCSIIVKAGQLFRKDIEKAEKELLQAQNYAGMAKMNLQKKKEENKDGIGFYTNMMPRECAVPEYARIFVSFFETGRAQTLADATGLFEEYRHREKMESLARQQVAAANAARDAAIYAAEQSIRASASANTAARNSMYNNR